MRRVKARAALCLLLACALLLGAPCARAEYRELREGMRGSDVLALKTAMYYLGYFTSLNLSDSYNAVMTQRVKNLPKLISILTMSIKLWKVKLRGHRVGGVRMASL